MPCKETDDESGGGELYMIENKDAYSRYLPTSPEAEKWGLFVTDCGFTRIVPGSPYPPGSHPPEYALDWQTSRVLREYQIVYITAGKGHFQSGRKRSRVVVPGTVFLLFPGVPHRYRPDGDTGWDEFWVGFNGTYADTLMSPPFFSPDKPLFRIGLHEQLLEIFLEIADLTQMEPFGFRHVIASKTSEILARIYAGSRRKNVKPDAKEERIREARCYLLEHVAAPVDFENLARQMGLSYATFRRAFRHHTGLAPNQYLLNLRIQKAKALLSNSRMPVQEIAVATGFDSIYYFSRMFKQKTGMAPIQWRSLSEA